MNAMTVAMALAEARALGIDRLDAQLLVGLVAGRPRTWVIAHGDAALSTAAATAWHGLAARRADGEPLAYLVGEKEFHGLALKVSPGVLVPRPETEVLVDRALEILRAAMRGPTRPRVVDLGTGSGAIALAVKSGHSAAEVCASDQSPDALEVAQANASRLGIDVEFRAGSWWAPWGTARFDLALANPPYVADGDPHLAALRHEPVMALTAGNDGLAALRTLVAGAVDHLDPGGWLLLEHGYDQAEAVRRMLHAAGFSDLEMHRDPAGQPRCSGGRL